MHVLHHQADPHLHSSYTYKWTRKQTHGIYCGLGCPRRISHVPKTKYLQTYFIFYLHSHLAFCMFVLECAKTCMCQCVHVLCRSCLLRRWIKQKVHLICKTLQGKQANTHTHTLAYSIKIISVTESILRSSNKPFFPWYKSLLFIPA